MRIISALSITAALAGAVILGGSTASATDYPSCNLTPKPAGCGGRGPGSTTTGGHTSGGTFYPSCQQSPKPAGCGGRGPGTNGGKPVVQYPSCNKSPKPANCGGRAPSK